MLNLTSNMGFFVVCIALILTAFTKWHKSIHLDELPEYKRSVNHLRAHVVIVLSARTLCEHFFVGM